MIHAKCLVCGREGRIIVKISSRKLIYKCTRCGEFNLEKEGTVKINNLNKRMKAKLSEWLRKQSRAGYIPVIDGFINFDELLADEK